MHSTTLRVSVLFAAVAFAAACSSTAVQPDTRLVPASHDARMAWWRDARFGMFVHWGLYAIPAGRWGQDTGHGEWIRDTAQIPVDAYAALQPQWDPARFDADVWAHAAAAAGMKYLVVTSKHHDGFCLWDSAATDWDVGNTKGHRDVLRELADACARHGVVFCTYHSIMDWHHADYLPRRPWEASTRPADGADFDQFEHYLHTQVTEVVQRYRPGVMWFDGEWEPTWSHERGVRLFDLCRSLAPGMIVNNRVDVHRGGMGGFSDSEDARGDFATPEQEIPATGLPGVDWESCMTMNEHWGWNAADTQWKSAADLVHNLVDIASKGGNYLLNVGPRADGTFPPEAIERLAAIGAWMATNGEAIHGTTASVFDDLPWGRCTVKRHGDTTTLYLHVLSAQAGGWLELPGLTNHIVSARVLGDPAATMTAMPHWGNPPRAAVGPFPGAATDGMPRVLAVEIEGSPVVARKPAITAAYDRFVTALDVTIASNDPRSALHVTVDGTEPSADSPATATLRLTATTTVRAITRIGDAHSATAVRTFTKVDPLPPVKALPGSDGLFVERFDVDWKERLGDLTGRTAASTATAAGVVLPDAPGEHVALRFSGFVDASADDVYRFVLGSDDGSRLRVDGELVVDNDGAHAAQERDGTIALARGLHRIEVVWWNRTGGTHLELRWARPGESLAPIPIAAFRH